MISDIQTLSVNKIPFTVIGKNKPSSCLDTQLSYLVEHHETIRLVLVFFASPPGNIPFFIAEGLREQPSFPIRGHVVSRIKTLEELF